MGKKKAGKLEENEVSSQVEEGQAKEGGKKSKKSKRKDWEEDVARELEELALEGSGGKKDDDDSVDKKDDDNSVDKKDDDNSVDKKTDANEIQIKEEKEEPKPVKENEVKDDGNKKGKKSKKSKRKGNNDDEEDIEQMLEEIACEYRGEKPKDVKPEPATEAKENNPLVNGEINHEAEKNEATDKKADASKSKKKGSKNAEAPSKRKQPSPEISASVEKDDKKKKKKSKAEKFREEEEAKSRKGKPNEKMLQAMREMLAKKKEEEERLRREAEERQREEEERIRELEEQNRIEEQKKEEKRLRQKEKMKRLKEEGKLLTPKQRLEQKRAKAMLEYLKAQGVAIPGVGEKPMPTVRKSKKKKQERPIPDDEADTEVAEEKMGEEDEKEAEAEEAEVMEEEDVIDAWDEISDSELEEDSTQNDASASAKPKSVDRTRVAEAAALSIGDDGDSGAESDHEKISEAAKKKERAKARIEQRKIDNEKNRIPDNLRAPVVCVLGHVDHGKTKILDKLRRTNVQEGEVGGITQQIGATNVPSEAIRSQTRMVKDFDIDSLKFPGLLIIDTPGHESFSNLRTRGSSLCDIAILVVDITQGLEPQTVESINLLKARKTPFLVALNKVDRVFEWEPNASKDIREVIKLQNTPCKNDFERRKDEIIQALNEQGLNAALFWENPDPRSYVSLVPTSAISGDGMGNLISLSCSMCQKRLFNRLTFSEELQCTVLEVKTIQGHGTTIDIILVNGRLREGDTVILAGTEGPIVTQIRSLLLPKPLREIRVKGQYDEFKEVQAALGVKIAAKELEKAIAGLNLQVAYHDDEVEILKDDVDREFKNAMRSMKVKDKGVYVQASTLGALEALLEFFKANKVPYSGIRVGPVVKKDVMRAAAMKDHDPMYAVILAFDVKVEKDAQELADKERIQIFTEETIYHLGDRYVEYIKEYKRKRQDEFRNVAVFPCKLKIMPTEVHNKRSPIILGVTVDSGVLRSGTPLCVPSKEFVDIGVVTSLEFDHKNVDLARKGVDVCIKIEPLPGHTPKLFGRHFDAEDMLISKISRESIDACKEHFRDDLNKNDWKLMAELKRLFQIL